LNQIGNAVNDKSPLLKKKNIFAFPSHYKRCFCSICSSLSFHCCINKSNLVCSRIR